MSECKTTNLREVLAHGDWPIVVAARAELDALVAEREAIKQQAAIWKQEALTQRATVHEAYQVCTGSTGEPGSWNGAGPIRQLAAERDALRARLDAIERQEPVAWRHSATHDLHDYAHQVQLADRDEFAEPLYVRPVAAAPAAPITVKE